MPRRLIIAIPLLILAVALGTTAYYYDWPADAQAAEAPPSPPREGVPGAPVVAPAVAPPSSGDEWPPLPTGSPKRLEPEFGYTSSAACITCHPDEHQSWAGTYHRTMTQLPAPNTIRAPFHQVTLTDPRGWKYHLQQEGNRYWIDMVDLDWFREHRNATSSDVLDEPPRRRQEIVMVTGSHHKQAFWTRSGQGEYMLRVPWSYRIDDGRWIPIEYDFLAPPGTKGGGDIWDTGCIRCHAVGGQPRANERTTYDTHVAELGISCESCHGPAAEHVRYRKELAEGKGDVEKDLAADPIINPARCASKQGAQVCGSCHSFSFPKDQHEFSQVGYPFRPGNDLDDSRIVVQHSKQKEPWVQALLKQDPHILEGSFWPDGTIRVAGREYNGLLETACFQKGEMSCTSCHSMHSYQQPDDLLDKKLHGNEACLQCHGEYRDRIAEHTHHPAHSSGSECQNCHMPHTTYGLFKAVRAHRIDSPSVATSVRTGRPNACNLCHLDRTLAWSAEQLTKWYGLPAVSMDDQEQRTAASLLWLLRGDAVQRGLVAWHMGWKPAQEVSGVGWIAPHLAMAFIDPYPAVRNVAGRSLKTLPGFTGFQYDFLGSLNDQKGALRHVAQTWMQRRNRAERYPSSLLMTPQGIPDTARVLGLMQKRSNRFVFIDE